MAGEPDEDGLQAGFSHGEVAQAVGIAGADDFGQQAVGVVGEDADSGGRGFDAAYALHPLQLANQRGGTVAVIEVEGVDLLRADRSFQRGGRVFDQNLAVVDDGDAVAEFVGLFHVVGGEDDGDALFAQAADGVPHGDAALRVEAGAGFVEKEDLGAMGDGAGDLDALGEAAGELRGIGLRALG